MDRFSVYAPRLLPRAELFTSGRRSCKGCGKALAARIASKAVSNAPAAAALAKQPFSAGGFAHDGLSADMVIERYIAAIDAVNSASGQASRSLHKPVKKAVIGISRTVFAEDFLALARIYEGDKKALYLCFDNEHYIDDFIAGTGPQLFCRNEPYHGASAHDISEIIREKNIPPEISDNDFSYFATACPSYPFDLVEKVKRGAGCQGNGFILILTPCPTGWIFPPRLCHRVGLSAVETGYFPLYENFQGRLRITQPVTTLKPLQQYLAMQKRFFNFPAELILRLEDAVSSFYRGLVAQEEKRQS